MNGLYAKLLRPLLFRLDPERAHHLAEYALRTRFPWRLAARRLHVDDPRLRVDVGGLAIPNPVGLAPGFDKNARMLAGLTQLGFGYVIVGGILPEARPGNPRPRVLRYVDQEALINCYGLPSDGLAACTARLSKVRRGRTRVLANIDAFSIEDYVESFRTIQAEVDAVEVHTACPNNVDETREFLHHARFCELLEAIAPLKTKPLFVKLLPWSTRLEREETMQIAASGLDRGVDGYTIAGTWDQAEPRLSIGRGHVSGGMTFPRTVKRVRELYSVVKGRAAIKASGGISSGAQAFQTIAAGATTVELVTGLIYQGPGIAWRINTELLQLMGEGGYAHLDELRGSNNLPPLVPARRRAKGRPVRTLTA